MPFDSQRNDLTLGIIGAGAMGRGIAQVAASGGINVRLFDSRSEAVQEAQQFINKMLQRAVDKKRMSGEQAAATNNRIISVNSLIDLAPCHVVIEAIIEDLTAKQQLFIDLEKIVSDKTILTTNTSSLSVTAIASKCHFPARVAGMHFFNPVPLMRLVEIIDGVQTAPWVTDALTIISRRMAREPVQVRDVPGFLVNQVGRGYGVEAAQIVSEGVTDFTTADRILRDAGGFRMGPFELMDLTALDVTFPASEAIFQQHFYEPRYRPAQMLRTRMQAGRLGRKSNAGFYDYTDGQAQIPLPASPPDLTEIRLENCPVWVSQAEPEAHQQVMKLLQQLQVRLDQSSQPGPDSLILITPFGNDNTATAIQQGLDPARTIAIDTTVRGLAKHRTLMINPITSNDYRDYAHALFAQDKTPVSVINDCPGFLTQRIVAMIVNIGCAIAEQRTATPEDIDKAVELGLGYPHGPLAFGNLLGPDTVLKILQNLYESYGDPRYRPTLWLKRRASLGLSLLHSG